MSLQTYLAAKYMSGPKADAILDKAGVSKKKKRKPQDAAPSSLKGSTVLDEDGGWGNATTVDEQGQVEDVVIASDRSFKKRESQAEAADDGWITLKEPTPPPVEDEQPLVVEPDTFKGGLMTADMLRKRNARKVVPQETVPTEQEQETIYRDATGRSIDTKAERAEAARRKREREEKEAQKMEWGKGVTQREEEERKRAELAMESTRDLARYADDKSLNDAQKSEERWNDPAAAFLTKKQNKGPKRPEYKGPPPPPNRFGIKPGYRWDGVDRSNGFEKKLFQKANERSRQDAASHSWSVEDM